MRIVFLPIMLAPLMAVANPLFDSEETVQAVLSAPISQAYKERKQDVRLYREGSFNYKSGTDDSHRLSVKIRTRGNFRRLNCKHPPLLLNFKKKANDNTLFERQDKLKLVGPCRSSKNYQEYVGLEYLAYKLWQELSPYHFKTRLIELSYIDTDNKLKPWRATTFVIEDIDDAAKRLERKQLKQPKVKRQQMDLAETALLELYQLFIGNSDYSTLAAPPGDNCCHNAHLLVAPGANTGVIPLPYDFDVTGFVDAPYATPADQYPIKNVRQRYFTGWCKEEHHFTNAIQKFKDQKNRLYEIVQKAQVINEKSRGKALKYVDSFYRIIEDPERVQKEILDRCRGSVIKG